MKKYTHPLFRCLIAGISLLCISTVHADVVLAGFYDFSSGSETTPSNANELATGVSATVFGGDGERTSSSSTDGFYGDSAFAVPTGATVNSVITIRDVANAIPSNVTAGDQILEFTINNTGTLDIDLNTFYFDISVFDTNNSPIGFYYASGDLSVTDNTQIGSNLAVPETDLTTGNFTDASFDISSLADNTLSTGQSATFHLVNPNPPSESSAATRIDNIAFTGVVVPEPSSLLLVGVAGLTVLAFRRRK